MKTIYLSLGSNIGDRELYFKAMQRQIVNSGTRYDLDAVDMTAEDYLIALAQKRHQGDVERTARQMLTDFRKGALGAIALEVRPEI